MLHDFDKPIERAGTGAVKFDGRRTQFGTDDVSPLWVGDMDFAVPACVSEALMARIEHPVFGYSICPESLHAALAQWLIHRHQWSIRNSWVLTVPSAAMTLGVALRALTAAGDAVIVQPPVYAPLFHTVTDHHRRLILNPLREVDGRYHMDFAHLADCAKRGARMLMLCSPHNPVGRVWDEAELLEVLRIARKHDLVVFSDEVHGDLTYPGIRHVTLGRLAGEHDKVVILLSPNKTFGLAGLGLSALICAHANVRAALARELAMLQLGSNNVLSMTAFEAAYRAGADWLQELRAYLATTRDWVTDYLARELPAIRLIRPDATYLLWLDCRSLGMTSSGLQDFMVGACKVGLTAGEQFGDDGRGFMRMNIGTPRKRVALALASIKAALDARA